VLLGGRHRAAVGSLAAAARIATAGQDLLARQLGTAIDLSADRAARLALAVRARLARPQSGWRLMARRAPGCLRRVDVLQPCDARSLSHSGAGDGRRRRADRAPQRT